MERPSAPSARLRQIARFGRPFGMMRGGIVPIHQQRAISGVEIVTDETAGIGLLVHQRERRLHLEQTLIDLVCRS